MYTVAPNDYVASRVMTADPVTLVSCLFDGLIATLREARSALTRGDILARSHALTRGIEIIGELSASLNQEAEVSSRLSHLYEYMIWRLTEANIQQAEAPICEVERLAGEFAAAWREIAMNGPATANTQAQPMQAPWDLAQPPEPIGHVSLLG